jgi:two-component system chemotaxis sensor kinase CheA
MAIDKQADIFNAFLAESAEFISDLERDVLDLERDPDNRGTIDNIFRGLHSLKGNSSLFGLTEMKLFLHQLENLADKIRNREKEVTTKVVTLLLNGNDHIRNMFERLREGDRSGKLILEEEEFLEQISNAVEAKSDGDFSDLRSELLIFMRHPEIQVELQSNQALKDLFTLIDHVSPELLKERRGEGFAETTLTWEGLDVTRDFNVISTIIDEVLSGNTSEKQYAIINKIIDSMVEKHRAKGHGEAVEIFESLLEEFDLFYHDESGFDEVLAQLTGEAMKKYSENLTRTEPGIKSGAEPDRAEKQPSTASDASAGNSSGGDEKEGMARQIKIDQSKLDTAIDTAGELVTISEFFNFIQTVISNGSGEIKQQIIAMRDATISLQELTDTLSRELYDIRKVPIEEAFQKLPRIIRDEQKELGKHTWLTMKGEDTMIDKSLVPKIETILVHMVRNSLDHGIEKSEERMNLGKSEKGLISIIATADDTNMTITVEDDGRGIDVKTVTEKAIKCGSITPEEAETMSEEEMLRQIFLPGVSTAEKVTELSGRGVGMDIVYSSITEMEGALDVESKPGKGTKITLKFPLSHTTMVKKGLAVAVGKSVFLIPIEMVIESFRPDASEIATVQESAEIVKRRGEIVNLIRLHKLFNIETSHSDPTDSLLVTVQHKRSKICLMVDTIIGQRQIIYKDLGIETLKQPPPYEGVSVYDGSRLAMILDIDGIIKQSEQ